MSSFLATYNPEFIAIVDTWLSPEISDSEIYTICSVMITIDVVVVYCYMLRIVLELSCLHLFAYNLEFLYTHIYSLFWS